MQNPANDAATAQPPMNQTGSGSGHSGSGHSGKRLARLFAFRLNRSTRGLDDEIDQDLSSLPTISCESVDDERHGGGNLTPMLATAKSVPVSPNHYYYCSSSDSSSPASECSSAAIVAGRPRNFVFAAQPAAARSFLTVPHPVDKEISFLDSSSANLNAPSSSSSAILNLVGQMPKLRQKMKMKSRQTSMTETCLWRPNSMYIFMNIIDFLETM
uniref:Uncharacterized protein n=1 Tax=Romanomermis culicivorax TaxID=13658 RepID=A0A915L642_ROMCU